MILSEEIIQKARRGNAAAVEAVLAAFAPSVVRMSAALTGSANRSRSITRSVLSQGAGVMGDWREGLTPENWFYHHTVLTARLNDPAGESRGEDVLIVAPAPADPAYRAFIIAL